MRWPTICKAFFFLFLCLLDFDWFFLLLKVSSSSTGSQVCIVPSSAGSARHSRPLSR
uniref:Uncharacterized protein n=1 Tax=Anguilla anguilla TaxID=7936 RepID=A0A0E9QZ84_ANGAN